MWKNGWILRTKTLEKGGIMRTAILILLVILAIVLLIVKNLSFSQVEDKIEEGAIGLIEEVDKTFATYAQDKTEKENKIYEKSIPDNFANNSGNN